MEPIHAIKGTTDILPGQVEIWQTIEKAVRKWMRVFGCEEIRTPVFEETRLFARSIGDDTDIVGKEMYTFTDMGGRNISLRPEGTASVIRAFIENSLDQRGLPQSLWYMGPMFRQERPQKGRHRQFHQFGAEVIGERGGHVGPPLQSPRVDADIMDLFNWISGDMGLSDRKYMINYIGGSESRARYKHAFVAFLDPLEQVLCPDCRRRKHTNPLRVLDCKVPSCRDAIHSAPNLPPIADALTSEDSLNYNAIKQHLDEYDIRYEEDPFLVRGLDYYTGIVFEMHYKGLGAQSAIMGGGRYDTLVKDLGGPDLPAVGFACGIERLMLAMRKAGLSKPEEHIRVFVVNPPDAVNASPIVFSCVREIRRKGFIALTDYQEGRSVKAQMRSASRANAHYVLFISDTKGNVEMRDMRNSMQKPMSFQQFLSYLENQFPSHTTTGIPNAIEANPE